MGPSMLLGDLIARLEDETVAAETLLDLGDLALTHLQQCEYPTD
jgi:hypothetical protein